MASENWAAELQPFLSDIAEFLDLETLVACYGVCSEWQIHLSKDEFERIWQKACEVCKANSWDVNAKWWRKAVCYFARLKLMKKGECFVEEELPAEDVNCMYVYGNRIGVGHLHTFEMYKRTGLSHSWELEFPLDVHDVSACAMCDVSARCFMDLISMKFDDKYLFVVCRTSDQPSKYGTYQTVFKSFVLKSRQQRAVYEGYEDCTLISYDFESEMDIVAGSYSSVGIRIWELSTGNLLKIIAKEPLITKVKLEKVQPLVSSDTSGSSSKESFQATVGSQEGEELLLFGVGINRLIGWDVYDLLREGAIRVEAKEYISHKLCRKQFHGFVSSSLLRSGNCLYFPQTSPCGQSGVICEMDMEGGTNESPHNVATDDKDTDKDTDNKAIYKKATDKIKNLLAIGEKYIAYHTTGENGIGEQVHVMEMLTGKLIARCELPELRNIVTGVEQDRVYFCDQNFLDDGLDLNLKRDGELFLAYQNGGTVRLRYWKTWKDIDDRALVVRQSPEEEAQAKEAEEESRKKPSKSPRKTKN